MVELGERVSDIYIHGCQVAFNEKKKKWQNITSKNIKYLHIFRFSNGCMSEGGQ